MKRLLFVLAITALVAFLATQFPNAVSAQDDKMRIAYLGALLLVCSLFVRKIPIGQTMLYAGSWTAIFALIIFGYVHREEIMNNRYVAELFPSRPRVAGNGTFIIRAGADGHFHIDTLVNGAPVRFMIDTGASDVVLGQQDARRAGINPDNLNYTRTYQTANGPVGGAVVKLRRLEIGPFRLDDFPATINKSELDFSLLGMSALRELGGFRIEGDEMVIGK